MSRAHRAAAAFDALEAYLGAPPLPNIKDPIAYWSAFLASESDGALARMALDFLSVPGTSFMPLIQSTS